MYDDFPSFSAARLSETMKLYYYAFQAGGGTVVPRRCACTQY